MEEWVTDPARTTPRADEAQHGWGASGRCAQARRNGGANGRSGEPNGLRRAQRETVPGRSVHLLSVSEYSTRRTGSSGRRILCRENGRLDVRDRLRTSAVAWNGVGRGQRQRRRLRIEAAPGVDLLVLMRHDTAVRSEQLRGVEPDAISGRPQVHRAAVRRAHPSARPRPGERGVKPPAEGRRHGGVSGPPTIGRQWIGAHRSIGRGHRCARSNRSDPAPYAAHHEGDGQSPQRHLVPSTPTLIAHESVPERDVAA